MNRRGFLASVVAAMVAPPVTPLLGEGPPYVGGVYDYDLFVGDGHTAWAIRRSLALASAVADTSAAVATAAGAHDFVGMVSASIAGQERMSRIVHEHRGPVVVTIGREELRSMLRSDLRDGPLRRAARRA